MSLPSGKIGWDFVKLGNTYGYEDTWFSGNVLIVEDKSDDNFYIFTAQLLNGNIRPAELPAKFVEISYTRKQKGGWTGMPQLYSNLLKGEYKYV